MSNEFPKFPEIPVEIMNHHNDFTGSVDVWLVKNQIYDMGESDSNYTCIIGFLDDDFCPEDILDNMEANPSDINWLQEIRDAMYANSRTADRFEYTAPTPQAAIGSAIVKWHEKVHKEIL